MRGSVRREVVVDVPADTAWRLVGPPDLLHHWFPGVVACEVAGDRPHGHPRLRADARRDDPHQRPAAAPLPVPDHGRLLHRAPGARSTSSPSTSTPCLVTYATDADPATMAIVLGGATGGALAELRRQLEAGTTIGTAASTTTPSGRPDGPQDPARHDRPAALRHARAATAARWPAPRSSTGSPPRACATSGRCPQSVVCMPSRSTMLTGQHPSTHGVWMNGVALPVDAPSVAAELHRAGYRTALVGKPHFEPFIDPFGRFAENGLARRRRADRRLAVGRRHGRSAPGLRPPRVRHPRRRWARCTTPGGWRPTHPEAVGGFYAVLDGDLEVNAAGRRRHRRAAGEGQPHPPRLVPHRLGGRSHDRLARRPRRRRRLVLLDELPRPAPPVGPAGVRAGPRRLARRAAPRRLRRGSRPSASASSTPSPGTGGSGTTARSCRTTRPRPGGCRPR